MTQPKTISRVAVFIFVAIGVFVLPIHSGTPAAAAQSLVTQTVDAHECQECAATAERLRYLSTLTVQDKTGSSADHAVVHAVLFWMNGCPHCHFVIDEVLPPLQNQYGDQLDILKIEIKTVEDFDFLVSVANHYGYGKDNTGVPFLIIGDFALMGSKEIPDKLPGLIKEYLAQGGVDFPDIPELKAYLPEPALIAEPTQAVSDSTQSTEPINQSAPVVADETTTKSTQANGFGLAIAIMIGMVIGLIYSAYTFAVGGENPLSDLAMRRISLITIILMIVGFGVAGYLSYVEVFEASAVCGPVGDCNAVQTSPYAKFMGIPVGVIGLLGYLGMFIAWLLSRTNRSEIREYAALALFGMSFLGTIFSLYLTYLEPFVIRAVCAWCLTSAVVITLVMVFNARPAAVVFAGSETDKP